MDIMASTTPRLIDEAEAPPHIALRTFRRHVDTALLIGVTPILIVALLFFGMRIVLIVGAAAMGATLAAGLARRLTRRGGETRWIHAAACGVLLAMTAPPTISPLLAMAGGFAGIMITRVLLGGHGNYLWHPALVGWAFLQVFFTADMSPPDWPVLARQHWITGDLAATVRPGHEYQGYFGGSPDRAEAWKLWRPVDSLIERYEESDDLRSEATLHDTVLYELPPLVDTIVGAVGGGLGETSTVAILIGALWLMYLRQLRWELVLAAVAALLVCACVAPIRLGIGPERTWFPMMQMSKDFPIAMSLIMYHLTGGGFLLACSFFAADSISTPLTTRGHVLFGIGLGVLTMVFRVIAVAPGSCYWAVLAMNTLVPAIDRVTRRRIYGTRPTFSHQRRQTPVG